MGMFVLEPWVLATCAAAAFQTVRFMLQKQVSTGTLSASGATFARFVYALPFVAAGLIAHLNLTGQSLPTVQQGFWRFGFLGAVTQILATVCVILLFKERNFAVGITFKKTEMIQTVLVGWILLGESVSAGGFGAISVGIIGLLLLSRAPDARQWRLRDLGNKAAGLGLASGILFAFSAVSYRGASLAVPAEDAILRAAVTLAAVVSLQTLIMIVWLALFERGEITAVWRARRVAIWIGITSMAGSLCWFIAFTLQNAAYVKALGQIELVLSIAAATLFFREKITGREVLGMAVLMASILILVLTI
ncbi:MAG: DMT family transporter [Pseudomonadota bacterium]